MNNTEIIKTIKDADMIGICSCKLENIPLVCEGDYMGADGFCDNPFIKSDRYTGLCRKLDINNCKEKLLIK